MRVHGFWGEDELWREYPGTVCHPRGKAGIQTGLILLSVFVLRVQGLRPYLDTSTTCGYYLLWMP